MAGVIATFGMAFGAAYLLHASIDQVEEAQYDIAPQSRHLLLEGLDSWGYQLRGLDAAAAARSSFDLVVIDPQEAAAERSPERLKILKSKPDGGRRLVLAHLSIGAAEDHRPYWQDSWTAPVRGAPLITGSAGSAGHDAAANPLQAATDGLLRAPTAIAPTWLGSESPARRGTYAVRYWEPAWQAMLLGNAHAALDRVIAGGFDGIYLHAVEAYAHWAAERPEARSEITALIERLSEYGRARVPGFIVVMQNGEELLSSADLRKSIDAVAKANLFHGASGNEAPNSPTDVAESIGHLRQARRAGLPVLVLEHVSDAATAAETLRRIGDLGFTGYIGPRNLDQLRFPE
jgi:cysteinyl-tRNA synthetase, unknown class